MQQSVRDRFKKFLTLGGTSLALIAGATAVQAQTTTQTTPGELPGESNPGEEPVFTRAGSWLFQPQITVGMIFDDNIFVEPTNEVSDLIFVVKPRVGVQTNLPRHGISAFVEGDIGLYLDHGDTDNYYDWRTGVEGMLDVTRLWKVKLGVNYEDGHEPRGEDESVVGSAPIEPVDKDIFEVYVSSQARFSRVILRSKLSYKLFDFSDADRNGGGVLEQDDRDRDIFTAESQMVFDFAEIYRPFIEVSVQSINYDKLDFARYFVEEDDPNVMGDDPSAADTLSDADFVGVNRDGNRYTAELGVEIDFTGVLFGEFKAGYIRRTFDDPKTITYTTNDAVTSLPKDAFFTAPQLDTIDGPRLYGSLTYLPSQISSIDLVVQREVGETTLTTASGFTTTDVLLAGQYEIERNLTVGAHFGYTTRTYENLVGSDREDDWIRAGLGGTYDFTRNYSLNARYEYWDRDSTDNQFDYKRNIASVTFTAKL